MLIVSETVLLDIQQALVQASHGLVNERGERQTMGTIDDRRLEMAALTALMATVGEPVWPSNRKIVLPSRSRMPSPFEEQ